MPRSPFLFAVAPAVALAAGGVRWGLQGSGNLYTATAKRFYVPDPDLGYRVATHTPVWLGLDVLAVVAAFTVGVVIAALIIGRRERRLNRTWAIARWVVGIGALAPLALPVLAFASGGRPAGAIDGLPIAAVLAPSGTGISGRLDVPAGRYNVVASTGSSITASLKAGGDAFDARFAGGLVGFWDGNPGDLNAPMTSQATAQAASVDTGVTLRSQHAREEYLYTNKFPTVGYRLGRVLGAQQTDPATVTFRAEGTLLLMGGEHPITITGTLRALDAEAQARLKVAGPALLVVADTSFKISETALKADADSFDADVVPLHVSLVLTRAAS